MRDFLILFVPFDRHPGPTGKAGRTPFRRRRIRTAPASTAGPQSWSKACAQPACRGSFHRRLVHSFHAPGTAVLRSAIVLTPSTLLHLHSVLRETKVPLVVFARAQAPAWSKGPKKDLIDAVVAMKRRNPRQGCPHIAPADRVGFRRDRQGCCSPHPERSLPTRIRFRRSFLAYVSWPESRTVYGAAICSAAESATLRTHWVLVVMAQLTRRGIGLGVHGGIGDGVARCRMGHRAIRRHSLPKYLSSDHDPHYRFHQWQVNLRVLEVAEIKTIPYVPLSHPFVERLIGTVRRKYLDRTLFWTTADLETEAIRFPRHYYNSHRTHAGFWTDACQNRLLTDQHR